MERFNATIAAASRGVVAKEGIVVSQHRKASEAGAAILRDGGNAVDAAVATAFALGSVEPWMSGIGGCGHMIVGRHGEKPVAVDFGVCSPAGIDIADFPLEPGTSDDLFPWSRVAGSRNTVGPLSVCAPSMASGMELAWKTFGRLKWQALLAPAMSLAREGLAVDWYTQLIVSSVIPGLRTNKEAATRFLNGDGTPPTGHWIGKQPPNLRLEVLEDTLGKIARNGAQVLQDGDVAKAVARDVKNSGGVLDIDDFHKVAPSLSEPELTKWYGDSRVWTIGGLTGGTSLARMLRRWQEEKLPNGHDEYIEAIAKGGIETLSDRLKVMGHSGTGNGSRADCTTSLCAIDRDGLCVAATCTLVSLFGSKVVSPATGILLNNGISWFDPEPGKPNSLAPGKPVLSNMAPTLAEREGGVMYALGAAGGRRIVPAIAQVLANTLCLGHSTEEALLMPRLDFAGDGSITADARLGKKSIGALAKNWNVTEAEPTVYPYHFALVSMAESSLGGQVGYPESFCPNASACPA